jgi:hypothetical protein
MSLPPILIKEGCSILKGCGIPIFERSRFTVKTPCVSADKQTHTQREKNEPKGPELAWKN